MMTKFNLALLSSALLASNTLTPRHPIADVFAEMEADMLQMQKQMRSVMEQFDQSWEQQRLPKLRPEIKSDGNVVVITLALPGKLHDSGLVSEASGNALRGAISCEGAKINFSIADGVFFSYSVTTTQSEKSAQGERQATSQTMESLSLPEVVGNLENVQPEVKDQTVILRLPKAKNWKKLQVK